MENDSLARLLYLVLLGSAIGGYFIVQNRGNLSRLAQQGAIWAFIFIGAIVAVGLWDDLRRTVDGPRATVMESGTIEVPRAADGHFYLRLGVNDTPVRFVVDTGASGIVLSREDARRVGLDPESLDYWGEANTANGMVRTARVRLDSLSIGGISDRNVTAWVNDGQMDQSLLGMSYLQRFAKIEIAGSRMLLHR
ncbi:TIGR02281 family clan AA aspartic protease [Maritimibacter sp. 55A14]|uniref:retropepsin-like aspartic protease family protein n=1 Tax=Maritimibacter sp. 55A14 TaxID=2174844 RepID=UPI000D60FC97|nr:TIGR02281 family clan AA aspartic protease [Maritimibacter sp. 55A14]PWE34161.1 TIGR02281 family clan AA aspartic protease [Maritimibacter sp. 55A14]